MCVWPCTCPATLLYTYAHPHGIWHIHIHLINKACISGRLTNGMLHVCSRCWIDLHSWPCLLQHSSCTQSSIFSTSLYTTHPMACHRILPYIDKACILYCSPSIIQFILKITASSPNFHLVYHYMMSQHPHTHIPMVFHKSRTSLP